MRHDQIIELIPWYANETLSDEERRTVATHLESCESCRRELQEFRIFADVEADVSRSLPDLPEGMLERALERIDELEAPLSPGLGERFGLWLRLRDWWTPTPTFARVLLVAQLVLLVGFAGLYVSRLQRTDMTTLGGGGEGPAGQVRISVRFANDASERAIRDILRDVRASITSGPSALGVYTVALPIAPEQTQEAEAVLEKLRNSPAITYAEISP